MSKYLIGVGGILAITGAILGVIVASAKPCIDICYTLQDFTLIGILIAPGVIILVMGLIRTYLADKRKVNIS